MKSLNFKIGLLLVGVLMALAFFAPWITPHDPLQDYKGLENLSPSWALHEGQRFILGTDQLGRDLLSRLIYGARYCLFMGCLAVLFAAAVGIPLGLYAGFHSRLDAFISKGTDIVMSFPAILIAIVIVAILGPGVLNAVIAVAITTIPGFVKLSRSQTKAEAHRDYVQAARTLGVSSHRILFRHIFPNILSPLLVLTSLSLGSAILESAALSFLNLGVTPPAPEWGSMIRSGMEVFFSINPWIALFSGFCIFMNVLGFNLLGDALRDRLDPTLR